MSRVKNILKNETVLIASLVLCMISCFFVKPSSKYMSYIDARTLSLLFCLMTVMAGLNKLGVFYSFAQTLLKKVKTQRGIFLLFSALCFFSSMVITNDVALITFVPFSILTLKLSGKTKYMIYLVTMETISANLGSMLLPIGNPQNLYLFSAYNMNFGEFVFSIFPFAALSFVLILLSALYVKKDKTAITNSEPQKKWSRVALVVYYILLLLSMLTVFRVIPYPVTLAVCVAVIILMDRTIAKQIDFSLLLTFVFLFVFIGNLSNIEMVSLSIKRILNGHELLCAVALSQIISNVPAAVLLSGFTERIRPLLIGVNIGGLGTLIASMASLISYKLIARENIKKGRYIAVFTILNLIFLAANLLLAIII